MSNIFQRFTFNLLDYIKSQYKQILMLMALVNIPYILIKVYWDNKIQTLFYIFLGLLVFVRIFFQNQSDNERFKTEREKNPKLSKQQIVHLVAKKKTQLDGSFFLSLIILIFSFLLI